MYGERKKKEKKCWVKKQKNERSLKDETNEKDQMANLLCFISGITPWAGELFSSKNPSENP